MMTARSKHSWNVASNVMAMIAEVNRDRSKRHEPFTGADFNPYTISEKAKSKEDKPESHDISGFAVAKAIFVDRKFEPRPTLRKE